MIRNRWVRRRETAVGVRTEVLAMTVDLETIAARAMTADVAVIAVETVVVVAAGDAIAADVNFTQNATTGRPDRLPLFIVL